MWQPIHLHANRFWFLATGHGDLNHCLGFKDYDDTRPVPHLDIINTLVRLFLEFGKIISLRGPASHDTVSLMLLSLGTAPFGGGESR